MGPGAEDALSDRERLRREMARRVLARRSYPHYLRYVYGGSWKRTAMSEFLAREVQRFVETDTGAAYDILLIETPPQHGKSMSVTESFPSWYLGRYPDRRVIEASYNDETARRFGRKNLEKVERFGAQLFNLKKGKIWTSTEFELAGGWGRMISRGILSGITGNPANLLLIDDPIKNREEADSDVYRDKLWAEWQSTLKSRLSAGAKVIVIMTPWHEDDFAGRLLKSEPNVRVLRLPVEAEENDPLGRKPGEPLCPELGKGERWLRQFKRGYLADPKGGQRAWAALYQCRPRVEGGNLVKRSWWRFYDEREAGAFGTELISVDAAFKDAPRNDFVALTVWGKRGNDYFLRACVNRHLDFTGTLDAIRTLRRLYPNARRVLIEDKANGSAILNVLRREMFCIGVDPSGGKIARVNAVSAAIESGHVFLPRLAPWLEDYISQWSAFPAGAHDDMVDSSTQALGYLIFSDGGAGEESEEEKRRRERRREEEERFFGDGLYEVYGTQYAAITPFREEGFF